MTLDDRLEALAEAVDAATAIGLDTGESRRVLELARERVGFPGDLYVLALAGGTGVGKSSLLNALAGESVSAVAAVRPTTAEPVAWVPDAAGDELRPLLEWLGVARSVGHAEAAMRHIAILDLPDVDSIRDAHRARVDEILPRIDSVAWVVDPEKYDDERLHTYFRGLTHHGDRMRFVLNKTDRLTDAQIAEVRDDLEQRLVAAGYASPRIFTVSATSGEGLDALRRDLRDAVDAKALITARLADEIRNAGHGLATAAGLKSDGSDAPLVLPDARSHAIEAATAAVLEMIDLDELRMRARGAVMHAARRTAGGLLGRVLALIQRAVGQQGRTADPARHLGEWRRRGTLARAANPIRELVAVATAAVPATLRPQLVAASGAADVEEALGRAVDDALKYEAAELRVPRSVLWPLVGLLQVVAAGIFLFAVAWYVTLYLVPPLDVASVAIPILGPLPMPLVLLAGAFAVSGILSTMLRIQAGWIGRRWAQRVAARVRDAVEVAVDREALAPLERFDANRRRLGDAVARLSTP